MKNKIKRSSSDRLLMIFVYVVITVFTIMCLLPFWLMLAGSITKESSILQNGYQFFPKELSLDAYKMIFAGGRVGRSYLVSIFVTVVGTCLSMLVTSMLAYALSVKGVRFINGIAFYAYFTMLFSGGMVPWYIVMTQVLHLHNSIWAMIVPYTINTWYLFLLRNFFKGIPDAIRESAKIDGAGDLRILFQIVLPLSLPALATVGLFYCLQYWNDWWLSLMLIDTDKLYPLQYLLRALSSNLMNVAASLNPGMFVNEAPPAYSVRMAMVVVTIGPIVLVYPFVQKYFVKGLVLGGVKG